jgi:hypothetical protein
VSDIQTDKLPADVLEQEVPIGGAFNGKEPAIALQTVAAGVTTTRDVPPLRANAFGAIQPLQTPAIEPFRIGRETRRRALYIACAPDPSTTAYLVVATTREQAVNGDGFPLVPGSNISLKGADMWWIAAIGAPLRWGFIAELDQG